ncbi:serine/arginine repetitive matrix protein 4-like [Narcine bancroftii]|uniref:serine/arginine repetitive matrix protein 4-like n=1 Tax=Narcine bancroftii TaxID=1343680 RepID=UPI00383195C0
MASVQQGEKQLFEKFWKGTFKAVATPRPESIIVASITARRTLSNGTSSYQAHRNNERNTGAVLQTTSANGCSKVKESKQQSHHRLRRSCESAQSPPPPSKRKKKKKKSEHKRRRSPSYSPAPVRKKKKKSSKKHKRNRCAQIKLILTKFALCHRERGGDEGEGEKEGFMEGLETKVLGEFAFVIMEMSLSGNLNCETNSEKLPSF